MSSDKITGTNTTVSARIPEWVAAEIYTLQHNAKMAKQPVRATADYIEEAWRLRARAASETTSTVEIRPNDADAKLARKFLNWFHKKTVSKTHKGMVQLISAELENEPE